MNKPLNTIILGGGASGLFCAANISPKQTGSVCVLEHNNSLGKKILISGGGRCNFTNIHTQSHHFVSQNPHFAKSALSRFTPQDFLEWVEKHNIDYFEKKLGQLFCQEKAKRILDMLVCECQDKKVHIELNAKVSSVIKTDRSTFLVKFNDHHLECENLVIATGGLSIPKIGASDLGYKIAKQFDLKVTKLHPALDGFRLNPEQYPLESLSGKSLLSLIHI